MKTKFIPIDYSTFDFKGRNYIKLVGRTEKGKKICVIDGYMPHLWAILKKGLNDKKIQKLQEKIEKIQIKKPGRTTKVEKTEFHNKSFLGKEVKAIKIFITNHKDGHDVADKLIMKEIEKRREYDLPLITKYITDKKVKPLTWQDVEGEIIDNSDDLGGIGKALEVDFCIKSESISQSKIQKAFTPRILAFDIETDSFEMGKGNILMISLYGKNYKKVLTWKKCKIKQDYVECFKDQEEMLEAFIKHVKDYSPDILTGYFSDGFDLPYLRATAEREKMKLSLGLDDSQPVFSRGKRIAGKIFGIVHIDLFRLIETAYSQYLKSETLSLNEVASELLGEKKHEFDFSKISSMKEEDWKEFFSYNLQDSALTYKLAEKLWPDFLEITKTVEEPLFNINRYGLSGLVENYLIHNLEKFNEIAEKRPPHDEIGKRRAQRSNVGAFVFQPTPGMYENLAAFDFTSMHTSIIVSFNISRTTLLDKKKPKSYTSPDLEFDGKKTKFYFAKEKGFFPLLLKEIFEKRKKFKKEYKENPNPLTKARSNIFKLLSASVHGYQAFFGARYYSLEAAAAVLAFVRKFNKQIIDRANEAGYKAIYGDTDSIILTLNNRSKKQALDFLEKLNSELPGIMELELEDFYSRGLFVSKRSGKAGAKKKYALIDEKEKLKIRGFETVRRDWCRLARDVQNKVIDSILREGNEKAALELVKETIVQIKKRDIDKKQLMIRTQLKKPINEYLSQGPHVVAAKKMQEQDIPISQGMLIEYFIAETRGKKKLVREKVKLPDEKGEYNIEYYLNNQILPAVENIFEVFNVDVKDLIAGHKQTGLDSF